jgi:hypothetical protein
MRLDVVRLITCEAALCDRVKWTCRPATDEHPAATKRRLGQWATDVGVLIVAGHLSLSLSQ